MWNRPPVDSCIKSFLILYVSSFGKTVAEERIVFVRVETI